MEKRDELFIVHISESIKKLESFTEDKTYEDFTRDDMLQSAVIHQLLIIGEAANKVSQEYRETHKEYPWRGMIGMRNKLIHDYFRISIDEIWKTLKEDIPKLKKNIE